MTERNFEARRFGDKHQAPGLADWCGGIFYAGTAHGHTDPPWAEHICITPMDVTEDSPKSWAEPGDWIIRAADGAVRIERGGNQAGYCTDCGLPVWWSDCGRGSELASKRGERWCYGKDEAHFGMTHHHALPGMAQYVVQAPDGQVCHCLDRDAPHIHTTHPPGGPPAPGHRTLNAILRDAIRAAAAGDAGGLPGLRAEYDAAAAALFDALAVVRVPAP